MDWSGGLRFPFIPRQESSFSFMCNYNYDQIPVLEMKQQSMHQGMLPGLMDKGGAAAVNMSYGGDPKKKRLSNEQLELLENSFQEEIKLDPDRKLKLSKELGLQPRQIAVWFQNRRARWKGKQLERLYDALKQEYDSVLREKQKLQQEVMALRAMLKEQLAKKQVSGGHTDQVSGEETVESTSIPSSEKLLVETQIPECNNYTLNVEDYNGGGLMMPAAYWPPPQLPREVVNGDY